MEGLGCALSLQNCSSQTPRDFSGEFKNIKNTFLAGGWNESGETQAAGQRPCPPIPQATPQHTAVQSKIPLFVYAASWVVPLEELQAVCQLPAGLPLRSCCTDCWYNTRRLASLHTPE